MPAMRLLAALLLTVTTAGTVTGQSWKPAHSANSLPHFESLKGKQVFFADGKPFTVLAVETQWEKLLYGRYAETIHVYDYLYPAAEAMGLNALKVPIKWSMVEPAEGTYDFSYVDHVVAMARQHHLRLVLGWFGHYASGSGTIYSDMSGNVFAPMYIIQDTRRFPRAVDSEGKPHHDAVSYDYPAVVEREVAAFQAFLEHLRQIDSPRTVLMIQVENEICVFGAGAAYDQRKNPSVWRDHSEASNARYAQKQPLDDLRFSAWNLASQWLRPLMEAGTRTYPLPLFVNFVGGSLAPGLLGGSPGEDVATYLETLPNLSFVGVNHYPTWGDETPAPVSVSASSLRRTLDRYRIGRNIPTVTETNSDNNSLAPRFLFLSVGEYGSPLFSPWAMETSCPTPGEPYVQEDGQLANGAFALREACTAIRCGGPAVAEFGGTERARVFLAEMPGQRFSQTKDLDGVGVTVAGVNDGQAIAIRPAGREMLILGFRCKVVVETGAGNDSVKVERGAWAGDQWTAKGNVNASVSRGKVEFRLTEPQAVRIYW